MADPEETLSTTDGSDGGDGDTQNESAKVDATDGTSTTEAPAGAQSTAEEESQVLPTASVDLSKISADDIVKLFDREDVRDRLINAEPIRRVIQSEKDKEIAKHERQVKDDNRRKSESDRLKAEQDERRRLLDENDYAALGELEARKFREEEQLSIAASKVAGIIENVVREHPDFAVLGEEKIDETMREVQRTNGNVIDFTLRLAELRRAVDVERATRETSQTIDERIKAEVEAALAAAGVEKRSSAVEQGQTASQSISGGSAPKTSTKGMTHDEASRLYGEGELSWSDFQPFYEEHERKRAR